MAGHPVHLLILDACVLIDFCKTDLSVVGLIAKNVGPVHIASPVLDEVDQLDESTAADAGLIVVEPPLDLALEAAARGGALSFQDWLCLLMAKGSGWTCVSNDGRLRRECAAEGVSVLWGLEPIGMLVRAGALTVADATRVAEAIHHSNPRFVSRRIVQAFVARLGASSEDE